MRSIGRPGKNNICTRLRIELPGSFMRRCLRIKLRSEHYAAMRLYTACLKINVTNKLGQTCLSVSGCICMNFFRMCSLLLKGLILVFYLPSLQLVLCSVAS